MYTPGTLCIVKQSGHSHFYTYLSGWLDWLRYKGNYMIAIVPVMQDMGK